MAVFKLKTIILSCAFLAILTGTATAQDTAGLDTEDNQIAYALGFTNIRHVGLPILERVLVPGMFMLGIQHVLEGKNQMTPEQLGEWMNVFSRERDHLQTFEGTDLLAGMEPLPDAQKTQISYALGFTMVQNLAVQGALDNLDMNVFITGMNDALGGQGKMNDEQLDAAIKAAEARILARQAGGAE